MKANIVEFGHLISVSKMEEDTKIEDVVNKESKVETLVLTELCLGEIKIGDIIQLERRGYFYVDKLADEHSPISLHFVPDGRSKNISVIKTKIDVKSLSKGEEKISEKEQKKLEKEKKKEAKAEKKVKKENQKKETQGENEKKEVNGQTEEK